MIDRFCMTTSKESFTFDPSWNDSAAKFTSNNIRSSRSLKIKSDEGVPFHPRTINSTCSHSSNHKKAGLKYDSNKNLDSSSKLDRIPDINQNKKQNQVSDTSFARDKKERLLTNTSPIHVLSEIESAFHRNIAEVESQSQTAADPQEEKVNKIPNHENASKSSSIFDQFEKSKIKKPVEVIEILSNHSEKSDQMTLAPANNPSVGSKNQGQLDFISSEAIGTQFSSKLELSPSSRINSFLVEQQKIKYQQAPKRNVKNDSQKSNHVNSEQLIKQGISKKKQIQKSIAKLLGQPKLANQDKQPIKSKTNIPQSKTSDQFAVPAASKWNIKKICQQLAEKDKLKQKEMKFQSPTPIKPSNYLPSTKDFPFESTDFYIHINLLPPLSRPNQNSIQETSQRAPESSINITSSQVNKESQSEENRRNNIKTRFSELDYSQPADISVNKPDPSKMWSSAIKKYKISNSNIKYKQQRIDNYFNFHEARQSFPRKIPTEEEQPIPPALQEPANGRSAKKSSKYPKQNHPLAIQSQLQLQNVNYSRFLQRRSRKPGQPRDLGVLTLDQLVEQCYVKEVLSQEIYVEYINHTSRQKTEQFVKLFMEGRMEAWDYNKLQITLMDHRRLAQVLVKAFPREFVLYQPEALQKEVNDFLSNLYQLSNSDYNSLLESSDKISGVTFWKSFKIKYQHYLSTPLLIFPYVRILPHKEIRWAEVNLLKSPYTPLQLQMMENRETRQKPKQQQKPPVYIEWEESDSITHFSCPSASSSSSSIPSEISYEPTSNIQASKRSTKKSGKKQSRVR